MIITKPKFNIGDTVFIPSRVTGEPTITETKVAAILYRDNSILYNVTEGFFLGSQFPEANLHATISSAAMALGT